MASSAILPNLLKEQSTQNHPQSLSGALFPTTFLEIALYLRPQDGSFREVQLYFFALPSTTRANF